ncbi:OmpP1/FadL family transporter [Vibrio agarivorans]|uniref:Outer membrane protein transport protein n=1 Tax=Vibrio agarivorans TaxID=153622 RepID=A0ABT7Y596_9VIBR|nr:outer membrane protein transport protein [Vibrio agarivorans]MDN2483224.1 outer membrane protein transport protein [Vibrio agarivorans]
MRNQNSKSAAHPSFSPSKVCTLSTLALAIAMATPVQASGILLQEAVVANAGTTGAGDGVHTRSAAAMWTNPATMSFMGESKTTINALGFDLKLAYEDLEGSDNGSTQSYQPSLAAFHTRQLNEDVFFGVGFGAAGGSSLDYGPSWAASGLLESTTLMMLQINPALSFKVNDQWSWGMGAQINYVTFEQETSALSIDQESDWALGFNMGVMYRHSDNLDFGFSFRSKVEHDLNASASLKGSDTSPITGVSTEVAMPAIVDLSARWGVQNNLDLLASFQWHRWSEWDKLPLNLQTDGTCPPFLCNQNIERDWSDVWKLAFGADYQLNSDWRLKAGISYESSPQNDASLQWVDVPVGEQWRYSVGAATNVNGYGIDFFYEYADLGTTDIDRTIGYPNAPGGNLPSERIYGQFDGRIHFIGLNVTF